MLFFTIRMYDYVCTSVYITLQYLEHDHGDQLRVGLLAGDKLPDDFVHDVLWRKEISQECWKYSSNDPCFIRVAFLYPEMTHQFVMIQV